MVFRLRSVRYANCSYAFRRFEYQKNGEETAQQDGNSDVAFDQAQKLYRTQSSLNVNPYGKKMAKIKYLHTISYRHLLEPDINKRPTIKQIASCLWLQQSILKRYKHILLSFSDHWL